jgi:hypothetical protein
MMYDRFGYPGLFAAYNAGPRRYADHLAGGIRLPSETIAYLRKTTNGSGARGPARTAFARADHRPTPTIFAVQTSATAAAHDPSDAGQGGALFAIRR